MRLNSILAITIILVSQLFGCNKDTLTIAGSETMYPMLKILEEDYNSYQDDVLLQVNGGGSKMGLKQLILNKVDIASSSLELEDALADQLASIDTFEVAIVAYDGIAIVINKMNPVKRMHLRQISEMFAGNIKNWRDVGGQNIPVVPVVRNDNSGTAAYMKRHILRQYDMGELVYEKYIDREYAPVARIAKNNREIAEIVSRNLGAISYMGMGSAETEGRSKVKKIEYALMPRNRYFLPSQETVQRREYMLSRPLMLVYRKNSGCKISNFIRYLKSKRAHLKIQTSGYLDILKSQILFKTLTIKGD
jgi:phosphate transport system substrate-binding protein